MAYTYQADVWCDECGAKIRAELTAAGKAPEDPDDETSYDSGDFPKYYDAENEESDSPENCASGDCAGTHRPMIGWRKRCSTTLTQLARQPTPPPCFPSRETSPAS